MKRVMKRRSRGLMAVTMGALMGASSVSPAMAQDGSFFTNDVFIEEDIMIEGAFDSGIVTETYDETVEEDVETDASDEQYYEDE